MANDAILEALVSAVEGTDLTPGVTLTVNGFMVSGLLVSSETYSKCLKDELSSGIADSKVVSSLESSIDKASAKGFLHLRDASITSGGGELPGGTGVLWRGRIEDVNGFTLGSF